VGSLENVALLFDSLDATTQLAQLLALDARQPVIAVRADRTGAA
jgi:hypothetical protein